MAYKKTSSILAGLASAATVAAHGHVTNIVINGVSYEGYDPFTHPYMPDPPAVIGWTAANTDNGFVAPSALETQTSSATSRARRVARTCRWQQATASACSGIPGPSRTRAR